MTSLSESFKRKLVEPIDRLFKEAMDAHQPPSSSGGRNYQPPPVWGGLTEGQREPSKEKVKKVPLGRVDETAFKAAMAQLNSLIGLRSAKRSLLRVANFARIESERRRLKLPHSEITFNCVFSGSPGTGKTSLARCLGKVLHALGLLQHGHTVEVDKSHLVGEFLGQTPGKVEQVFDEADGGVLFIDEAYSLTHDKDDLYGHEAIDMIVKLAEDRRDRVVVVVAGYPKEMRDFINSNPGLRSRFARKIRFEDFDEVELLAIQKQMIRSSGFDSTEGFQLRSELLWQKLYRDRLTCDSNARMVRNALEVVLENQAARLIKTPNKERYQLCELLPEDLDGVENHLRESEND